MKKRKEKGAGSLAGFILHPSAFILSARGVVV
jgi:hypothetical protein